METRAATSDDVDAIARTITLAFSTDPVWGIALRRGDGRTDHLETYWHLFVEHSVALGGAFMTGGGEAVSIWVPPGGDELSADGLEALESLLGDSLDADGVADIHTLYGRFDASRAPLGPHAYLSLLATDPDHRGRGVGQALLADDLARWDTAAVPAYLESTNPANDHRYARVGFRPIGGFEAVRDQARITAMWRNVGAAP